MPQIPSFRRLSPRHQAFVSAYFRNNCDPVSAAASLHPGDPQQSNVRRAWKVMQRDDVRTAIGDMHSQHAERAIMTKEDVYFELLELVNESKDLDAQSIREKLGKIKASRELLEVIMKLLGYGSTNINQTSDQRIEIHLGGELAPPPETIDIPAEEVKATVGRQLEMDFDPVRWSLDDLDDISEETQDDPQSDDLPSGMGVDPEESLDL